MRFLHTGDWHIGQLFHEYDRHYEHQQFLYWLQETTVNQNIDVLLITGDVFDLSNPSAASIRLFYHFLGQLTYRAPSLQIIVIAGNHDSAMRLEAPKPLLDNTHIHIVGVIERDADGNPDYEKVIIPIEKHNEVAGYCLAIPFLRAGDHPQLSDCSNPYAEGVKAFYRNAFLLANSKKTKNEFIIAMGHLHAQSAEICDHDINERPIIGGVESITADAFDKDIAYVALGHIHKAQRIAGKDHIRYCGSPLPMSFSETSYKHQVVVFEIEENLMTNIQTLEIPKTVELIQVPVKHAPPAQVIAELENLQIDSDTYEHAPFLQVRVLLNGPEPSLRHHVETALKDKNVRLARIDVRYAGEKNDNVLNATPEQLNELKPLDVFSSLYRNRYAVEIPDKLTAMFNEVAASINMDEN